MRAFDQDPIHTSKMFNSTGFSMMKFRNGELKN